MREINKIIIHCSATPENRKVTVDDIRRWHITERKWSDIGYHFVIHQDGSLHEGRDLIRIGSHVKGHNKDSIGVCYVGGCDSKMNPKDTRNEAQKESLDVLLKYLLLRFPNATVHGHNEFSSKACPSFDVQKEYGKKEV